MMLLRCPFRSNMQCQMTRCFSSVVPSFKASDYQHVRNRTFEVQTMNDKAITAEEAKFAVETMSGSFDEANPQHTLLSLRCERWLASFKGWKVPIHDAASLNETWYPEEELSLYHDNYICYPNPRVYDRCMAAFTHLPQQHGAYVEMSGSDMIRMMNSVVESKDSNCPQNFTLNPHFGLETTSQYIAMNIEGLKRLNRYDRVLEWEALWLQKPPIQFTQEDLVKLVTMDTPIYTITTDPSKKSARVVTTFDNKGLTVFIAPDVAHAYSASLDRHDKFHMANNAQVAVLGPTLYDVMKTAVENDEQLHSVEIMLAQEAQPIADPKDPKFMEMERKFKVLSIQLPRKQST